MKSRTRPAGLPWQSIRLLLTVVAIAAMIWGATDSAVIKSANGALYDAFNLRLLGDQSRDPAVLLMQAGIDELNPTAETWMTVLDSLEKNSVKAIVFSSFPTEADERFYQRAAQMGNVVFGIGVSFDESGNMEPNSPPAAAFGITLPVGVYQLPQSDAGIYRSHYYTLQTSKGAISSLEAVAAQLAGTQRVEPSKDFLVNYNIVPGKLPVLNLDRVINQGLVPGMVKNRTLFIGEWDARAEFRLPTSRGDEITPLEFHGTALNTLLESANIRLLPRWWALALFVTIALALHPLFRIAGMLLMTQATLSAALAAAAASWVGLKFFAMWLPLAQILIVIVITFFLVLRHRSLNEHLGYRRVRASVEARLQGMLEGPVTAANQDHWPHIVSLIDHTLQLDNQAFLLVVPGTQRLQEVTLNPGDEPQMLVKPQDYQQEPFNFAIGETGPVMLLEPILKSGASHQLQYLSSLDYAGHIIGFWAFSITADQAETMPNFRQVVDDLSGEISELLHSILYEDDTPEAWRGRQGISLGSNYFKLAYAITRMEARLIEDRRILGALDTGVAHYDLYGRLQYANDRFSDIFTDSELLVFKVGLRQILESVCDLSPSRCREVLRHALFEKRRFSLPVDFGGQSFLVNLHAVHPPEQEDSQYLSHFDAFGYLLEIEDTSAIKETQQRRDQLISRLAERGRKPLEEISRAIQRIPSPPGLANNPMNEVRSNMEEIYRTLDRAKRFLNLGSAEDALRRYPVDPLLSLSNAMRQVRPRVIEAKVSIQNKLPTLEGLVLAAPDALVELFFNLLGVLIDDAVENGSIYISASQTGRQVSFALNNDGFGMPDEQLQAYLFDHDQNSSGSLGRLRIGIQALRDWDGDFEAYSELGQGMSFTITLERFI